MKLLRMLNTFDRFSIIQGVSKKIGHFFDTPCNIRLELNVPDEGSIVDPEVSVPNPMIA